MTDSRISLAGIEEALRTIDPVFLDTPQFLVESLSEALGARLVFKIETLNPIRSFKGRGASYFAAKRHESAPAPWITASAGNFGQGLAYAARERNVPIVVFASVHANPNKVARMRGLGAEVRLGGDDFDEAKTLARRFAEESSLTFIEDGRDREISEGAGTIAPELARFPESFDTVLVPLGNGALINGIGTWMKAHAPATEVVGVGTVRAPAMERSFRAGKPIVLEGPVTTIADGVAPRVPVPEAVAAMLSVVDDVLLVEEEAIEDAMRTIFSELGLVVEGAGGVTLAAANVFRERFRGRRVALIVGGGNASDDDVSRLTKKG